MAITWNVVNRTGRPLDAVEHQLREKITRLEKLLAHFPEDALHLQIAFGPQRKDRSHPVTLNLRVPSDVLQVRKEGPTPMQAMNQAVAALAGRLERLKSRYRRDHAWKGRREAALPERGTVFTDLPAVDAAQPQSLEEMVRRVLREEYGRLLGFVRRQRKEYALAGTVPRNAISAEDVVHRVAETVLSDPDGKPDSMDYYTWCASLAFRYTRDAVRDYVDREEGKLPIELELDLDLDGIAEEGVEPEEFALNLLRRKLEPFEVTVGDTVPDPHADSPETVLFEREVVAGMRRMARSWPPLERQFFEMYFLEGFSADDLAATFECDRSVVRRVLVQIRARLRSRLADAVRVGSPWVEAASDERPTGADGSASELERHAALDPDRRRQRDAAAERTRTEFDALLIAMRRLESSLASAAPNRREAWTRRVRDDFLAVLSALERHRRSAGSPEGLFAEIRLSRPEMKSRVAELTRSQEELVRGAAELERAIAEDAGEFDFASIRRRAADLLLMIRQQHAQEVDLIYESFWQDIGGSE